jgi:MOSC domain-containing protein YiiM
MTTPQRPVQPGPGPAMQGTVTSVSCNDAYSFTKPVRDEIVLLTGIGVEGDVHSGVRVKHRGRVRADPTQPNLRQVHLMQAELFDEVGAKGYAVTPGDLGENVTTSGLDLLTLPRGTILRFGPPPPRATTNASPTQAGSATEPAGAERAGSRVQAGWAEQAVSAVRDDFAAQAVSAVRDDFAAQAGSADGAGNGAQTRRSGGSGLAAVSGVLAAAAATTLDGPIAAAAAAVAAAAARDTGADPRPAIIVAGLRNPCAQINGFRPGLLTEMIGHDDEGNLVRKAGVMAVVLRGGPIRPGDPVIAEPPPPPHFPLERV